MTWILRYFMAAPFISLELVIASFFINLLALSVPLFVTLVLQRYVAFGVDATLFTLTSGALIAVVFELVLRNARLKLAMALGHKSLSNFGVGAFGLLATMNYKDFSNLPKPQSGGLFRNLDKMAAAQSGQNICTLLDIPFAALFVGVIYSFSPALALIILAFIAAITLISWLSQLWAQKRVRDYEKISAQANEKVSRLAMAGETIRVFDPALKMLEDWKRILPQATASRNKLGLLQGKIQNQTGLLQALLSIMVIAYGAILVIGGALPVSVLVGVNILATRALGPFVRLSQISTTLADGKNSQKQLKSMAKFKGENNKASPLPAFSGKLALQDITFGHDGQPAPLFESLNLTLSPKQTLVVTGDNGTGKSSFARLLLGLNSPLRGQILADGTDISQLPSRWWRQQIRYFPQTPGFIAGTIKENIALIRPELDDPQITKILASAGLKEFIAQSPEGLDMAVSVNGDNLSYGIARKLAFARALAGNGLIALFDEPTDGLDQKGRNLLYQKLDIMARSGMTMIICSNEPVFLKKAHWHLDLNSKPKPKLTRLKSTPDQNSAKTSRQQRQIRIVS